MDGLTAIGTQALFLLWLLTFGHQAVYGPHRQKHAQRNDEKVNPRLQKRSIIQRAHARRLRRLDVRHIFRGSVRIGRQSLEG